MYVAHPCSAGVFIGYISSQCGQVAVWVRDTAEFNVSPSASAAPTRTVSNTATRTASLTPSPPICRGLPAVTVLKGVNGTVAALSSLTAGNHGMYTSGSCSRGYRTFFPGSRLVYSLFLGVHVPLGGQLTITTCGLTHNNTVAYLGTGCPTWDRPFGCLAGNDNAVPACPSNSLASTLVITASQSNYFIQLGGVNGEAIVSGLSWAYALPSSTSSPTRSRTRAPGPRSRSAAASASRTRKAK